MASSVVLGKGKIKGRKGSNWEVEDGEHTVVIPPENMKADGAREGLDGVLTYEYHLAHRATRVVCFRSSEDPIVRHRAIPVGMERNR